MYCRKRVEYLMIIQKSIRTIITKDEFDLYTVSKLKEWPSSDRTKSRETNTPELKWIQDQLLISEYIKNRINSHIRNNNNNLYKKVVYHMWQLVFEYLHTKVGKRLVKLTIFPYVQKMNSQLWMYTRNTFSRLIWMHSLYSRLIPKAVHVPHHNTLISQIKY